MNQLAARLIAAALALFVPLAAPAWAASATETIVLIRHGEKPPAGLGQINCQGLNRALALPAVLREKFGVPAAIMAPNPAEKKPDGGKLFNYIRPLATIEPTAVAFGLPIETTIGQSKADELRARLEAPSLNGALILVAWEHREIVSVAKGLLAAHGGDPHTVPAWDWKDFDSIYIVRLTRDGAKTTAQFSVDHQGLNDQPAACPGANAAADTHAPAAAR